MLCEQACRPFDQIIGNGGVEDLSPHSHDLTIMVFFPWGYLKQQVCTIGDRCFNTKEFSYEDCNFVKHFAKHSFPAFPLDSALDAFIQ
ncbi:hypothetical protein TNCV_2731321 [Trichonephila clavipes]|nr:hypothetical protein TNCV_2731321 [Trichonephila clavipes]